MRLAETFQQPVPEHLEKKLWAQIDELDRSMEHEAEPELEVEKEQDISDDLEP